MLDYVEINLKRMFQFIRVDLVNSKGQILMHKEFRDTSRIRIPFEQNSGLYFFKVQTQRGIKTFKVVKY
ncbi:MAG: T9SS type A sorting domain-containing protein [Flavobacteriaceae bacterium]|nr:T9SS type A sorting domain-containing protein [Flavobacteriaceae bacterium]